MEIAIQAITSGLPFGSRTGDAAGSRGRCMLTRAGVDCLVRTSGMGGSDGGDGHPAQGSRLRRMASGLRRSRTEPNRSRGHKRPDYRKAEDPNDILALFDVADVAKVRAWTEGADLRAAMEKSEVVREPVISSSADRPGRLTPSAGFSLTIRRGEATLALPASRKVRALSAYLAFAPHAVAQPVVRTAVGRPQRPAGGAALVPQQGQGVGRRPRPAPGRHRRRTRSSSTSPDCFVDALEIAGRRRKAHEASRLTGCA